MQKPQEKAEHNIHGSSELYERTAQDLPPGEDPPTIQAGDSETARDRYESSRWSETWLLQRAKEIYKASTDYLDSNITNKWEINLSHFNNEHRLGTALSARSRKKTAKPTVFRPKTRAMTKAQEAALTAALFSSEDIAVISAENPKDEKQTLSASINKAILQYRLKKRMPWFLTTVGAFQSTKVYGICISHQFWRYEVAEDIAPAFDDNGDFMMDDEGSILGESTRRVIADELRSDLVQPENFRFDPMCDWRDPANTSPYIIVLSPMYAGDVLRRMKNPDPKTGKPQWKEHPLSAILSARRQTYDRTRQAREGRERVDPSDEHTGNEFTTVWPHMNIIRRDGQDYVYWTLGTDLLLSDPEPLLDQYPWLREGERPFVVGTSSVEAFRNYPAGDVEQSAGLQEEINSIANQRLDNVALVLNKRYYVRRGSQVDLQALMRNVPGGGVMMNDPKADVETISTPDVTSSAYVEQDRLANEMDDLVGSFSPASVQQNSALNETVGGINQLASTAGAVQDYGIQVFISTWVERVLDQLVRLIQQYETDAVIITHAGDKAEVYKSVQAGASPNMDELIRQRLTVSVDVGMGNTDPVKRVERFLFGVEKATAVPGQADRIKGSRVTDEIFATLGYRDSGRFFLSDDEYDEKLKENPPQEPVEIQIKRLELEIRKQDNEARDQRERMKLEQTAEIQLQQIQATLEAKMEELYTRLDIETRRDKTARDVAAVNTNSKIREMKSKGAQGA